MSMTIRDLINALLDIPVELQDKPVSAWDNDMGWVGEVTGATFYSDDEKHSDDTNPFIIIFDQETSN